MTPKSSFGQAWGLIFGFWKPFEGSDFKWIIDQPKGWQKITKTVITAANGERDRSFGAGSAAEGWPAEAFGVLEFGDLQNTEFDSTRRV